MILKILAIVPDQPNAASWPEPFCAMVRCGELQIDTATDVYAAAAAAMLEAPAYDALLIDAELLARRDLDLLRQFKRHTTLPLWILPSYRGFALSPEAVPPGALPADHAVRALQDSRLHDSTSNLPESRRENSGRSGRQNPPETAPVPAESPCRSDESPTSRGAPENNPVSGPESSPEIPVANDLMPRYDASGKGMVLSEPELRALLGAAE